MVSAKLTAPSAGEVKFELPPMETPKGFAPLGNVGHAGNVASTSAPKTNAVRQHVIVAALHAGEEAAALVERVDGLEEIGGAADAGRLPFQFELPQATPRLPPA